MTAVTIPNTILLLSLWHYLYHEHRYWLLVEPAGYLRRRRRGRTKWHATAGVKDPIRVETVRFAKALRDNQYRSRGLG